MSNDLVAAARDLLRFRPGNEGPDGWTQFAGSDDEWDAMTATAWKRFEAALAVTERNSKRELFAAMAMQGLVTAAGFNPSEHDHVAGWAVKQADALLTALRVSEDSK